MAAPIVMTSFSGITSAPPELVAVATGIVTEDWGLTYGDPFGNSPPSSSETVRSGEAVLRVIQRSVDAGVQPHMKNSWKRGRKLFSRVYFKCKKVTSEVIDSAR